MFYYQIVFNRPITFTHSDLAAFTYASDIQIPIGARVIAELGKSSLKGVVVEQTLNLGEVHAMEKKGIVIKKIKKLIDKEAVITQDQIELAKWMANYYIASWGETIFALLPSARREKETTISHITISHFNEKAPELKEEQLHCIQEIEKAYMDDAVSMCYLYGITGSGKTEVFLACIQKMLLAKKQVIYLVPEITLVKQAYPLFCSRFGKEHIAVIHSHMTGSERLTEWNRIKSQKAHIVLGVRSCVFAPVQNLGTIIIDEEHDSSYKSSSTPRYHARQVAMKRCQQHGALLLMGSATPSVEAWAYRDKPSMKFLTLKKRVAGGRLPRIEIVSLEHVNGCISPLLQDAMKSTLKTNGQVLLLVNRRGFSHMFLCAHCGEVVDCPHCSVHLTYHQSKLGDKHFLLCHHCGYRSDIPDMCPSCNYVSLGIKGWGTQRIEQELQKLFPHNRIGRIDSDVAKDKAQSEDILEKFYRNEIQIMVGTQILAKGINIPNLELVGVLFADALLGIPDFRAEERAFSLLTQVAGRAGRFSEKGKVIIQAYGTDKNLFKNIQESNFTSFFEEELNRRREYNLAPYQRVVRLVFRGAKEETVQKVSDMFLESTLQYVKDHQYECSLLGPASCAIEKLANNYRYHMLLTGNTLTMLNQICRDVLSKKMKSVATSKKVYIEIDPDPINMF